MMELKRWGMAGCLLAGGLVTSGSALACVTKSGKDCSASATFKTNPKVKEGKLAPVGGLGVVHEAGDLIPLGQAPAPDAADDRAGSYYLIPNRSQSSGHAAKPIPLSVMRTISTGANPLVNADGSLTAYALHSGWVQLQPMATPSLAPVPVPLQASAPRYVGTPDSWYYVMPPSSANPHKWTRPENYQVLVNTQIAFSRQTQRTVVLVNPDGSLSPYALRQGWLRLDPIRPNLAPGLAATGAVPAEAVPTAAQIVAPNLAPQIMATPGPVAPGQVPQPGQIVAPNLAPQTVATPGPVAPGQVPQPGQIVAPNLAPQTVATPGPLAPGQVPQPGQIVAPNLAPQTVATSGMQGPGGVPTTAGTQATTPVALSGTGVASGAVQVPSANGAHRAAPHLPVDVYNGSKAGTYRYIDARQTWDPSFHLVVIGFKEPQ